MSELGPALRRAGGSLGRGLQGAGRKVERLAATPTGHRGRRPTLSVIIVTYDMPREAPRTILSAGLPYQRGVAEGDYEVLVVDNGSTRRLPESARADLPPGVRLLDAPDPQPSPVFALNWAAREEARGDVLLFSIDGARIFSAGLYRDHLAAHALVHDAFVYSLSWHLGPKVQMVSTTEGYDEAAEDALLAEVGWPADPDALFRASVFAGSSTPGFLQPVNESSAFSVRRSLWERMGGFDERYTSPGGGLSNLELFRRYAMRPGARNVCLLAEGSSHQVHGGVATSGKAGWDDFDAEHEAIFGERFTLPTYDTLYYGRPRPELERFWLESIGAALS